MAENQFAPWNSDVATGDSRACILKNYKRQYHEKSYVLNGAQAGAYFLIRFFQVVISSQDGPNCRFDPVCSLYAKEAVRRYGAFLGAVLAGDRLLRCNPFNRGGPDPVPESLDYDH